MDEKGGRDSEAEQNLERAARGRFAPGHSGGPGRPRGFARVAKAILDATRDGDELVEWALRVWRDGTLPHKDREAAHNWLSMRSLGKPVAIEEITQHVFNAHELHGFDLATIPTAKLAALQAALAAMRAPLVLESGDD